MLTLVYLLPDTVKQCILEKIPKKKKRKKKYIYIYLIKKRKAIAIKLRVKKKTDLVVLLITSRLLASGF